MTNKTCIDERIEISMPTYTTRLIHLGLWMLPITRVLKLLGQFGTFRCGSQFLRSKSKNDQEIFVMKKS